MGPRAYVHEEAKDMDASTPLGRVHIQDEDEDDDEWLDSLLEGEIDPNVKPNEEDK